MSQYLSTIDVAYLSESLMLSVLGLFLGYLIGWSGTGGTPRELWSWR